MTWNEIRILGANSSVYSYGVTEIRIFRFGQYLTILCGNQDFTYLVIWQRVRILGVEHSANFYGAARSEIFRIGAVLSILALLTYCYVILREIGNDMTYVF